MTLRVTSAINALRAPLLVVRRAIFSGGLSELLAAVVVGCPRLLTRLCLGGVPILSEHAALFPVFLPAFTRIILNGDLNRCLSRRSHGGRTADEKLRRSLALHAAAEKRLRVCDDTNECCECSNATTTIPQYIYIYIYIEYVCNTTSKTIATMALAMMIAKAMVRRQFVGVICLCMRLPGWTHRNVCSI